MSFFEVSPKTNQNVNEVFTFLVQEILKYKEGKTQNFGEKLKKEGKNKDSKNGCYK